MVDLAPRLGKSLTVATPMTLLVEDLASLLRSCRAYENLSTEFYRGLEDEGSGAYPLARADRFKLIDGFAFTRFTLVPARLAAGDRETA